MLFPRGMTTKSDKTFLVNAVLNLTLLLLCAQPKQPRRPNLKMHIIKVQPPCCAARTRTLRHVSIMSHDTTPVGKLKHNLRIYTKFCQDLDRFHRLVMDYKLLCFVGLSDLGGLRVNAYFNLQEKLPSVLSTE